MNTWQFISVLGRSRGVAVTIRDEDDNIIWNTRSQLSPSDGGTGATTRVSGSFGTITVDGGGGGYSGWISGQNGANGNGGDPNGVSSPSVGTGGNNNAKVSIGNNSYGPFGTGGDGGTPSNASAKAGSPGAVILAWGNRFD